jgi:rhodanese-related sulfurtransferase
VRHTVSFNQLPLEHVMQALQQMTTQTVKAGDAVVTQGDKGDAFYVICTGRAEVWKAGIYDDEQKLVDTMGPGDSFGDEALVTGGTRNATVKMVEDGELLVLGGGRLPRADVPAVAGRSPPGTRSGHARIDGLEGCRRALRQKNSRTATSPDALHLPLPELRQRVDAMLDKSGKYITVCLSGKRSAVAAFLLKQRGYDVVTMKDGMSSWEGELAT